VKSLIKRLLREKLINEKMVLKDYSTYIELVAEAYAKAPNFDASGSARTRWFESNRRLLQTNMFDSPSF